MSVTSLLRGAAIIAAAASAIACAGPVGPAGPAGSAGAGGDAGGNGSPGGNGDAGSTGPSGPSGPPGASGCAPAAGEPRGLTAIFTVAAPASGAFFAVGERPQLTLQLSDACKNPVRLADLATANLYVVGPLDSHLTKAASKLLNAVTDRTVRQHHYIDLKAPAYGAPALPTPVLVEAADGSVTFTLAPITDELEGTYTASVELLLPDNRDQLFPQADFQIGTATVETLVSGARGALSTCASCHQGAQNGLLDEQHSMPIPGFAPVGLRALDQAPISSCKACHNNDGFSPNPIVRKVHGAHRGVNQLAAGVAHPEYGLGADASLAGFLDVNFPSLPGGERDCTKCHVNDVWKTEPSRLACGTCHDNLFFDKGRLTPPRVFGKPGAASCAQDSDCAKFSLIASCNHVTGSCELAVHPVQTSDTQCSTCHSPDAPGVSPISLQHAIFQRTLAQGLAISSVTVNGATGAASGGSPAYFQLGDAPTVTFALANQAVPVTNLTTAGSGYSFTSILSGPTENPQRAFAQLSVAAVTYSSQTGLYTASFPAWPANAQPPINAPAGTVGQVNPPGSYQLYFYVSHSIPDPTGATQREVASQIVTVLYGASGPVRPRQIVSKDACNACHVKVQAHGGSRQEPTACSNCHTQGMRGRTVGAVGVACTTDTGCPGFAAGWETCQALPAPATTKACTISKDPTPNSTFEFGPFIHDLHFARLRGNYAESSNLVARDTLTWVTNSNLPASIDGSVLLPVDARNCQQCHADSKAACKTDNDCGIGQACSAAGTCSNTAYKGATARACTSCHDNAGAFAHAALNTYTPPTGPAVESCSVCHGEAGAFSVTSVHDITSKFVPTYSREP